LYRLLSVYFK